MQNQLYSEKLCEYYIATFNVRSVSLLNHSSLWPFHLSGVSITVRSFYYFRITVASSKFRSFLSLIRQRTLRISETCSDSQCIINMREFHRSNSALSKNGSSNASWTSSSSSLESNGYVNADNPARTIIVNKQTVLVNATLVLLLFLEVNKHNTQHVEDSQLK